MLDVVMLAGTANEKLFEMTCKALSTLFDSLEYAQVPHRVNLVETVDVDYRLPYSRMFRDQTFRFISFADRPFNYNAALNEAFQYVYADFVCVANNDLVFDPDWFQKLMPYLEMLDVASPICPGWEPHETMLREAGPDTEVIFGTRTSYEVSGWCFVIKKSALDVIRPFDEDFRFECQDNDMVDRLIASGHDKMGLVPASRVKHLVNQSHELLGDERHIMIEGAHKLYEQKRNARIHHQP